MKEKYERAELEISEFDADDVIATSGGGTGGTSDQYDDYEGHGFPFN